MRVAYMVNIYRSNQAHEEQQKRGKIEMFRPILFRFRFSLSILSIPQNVTDLKSVKHRFSFFIFHFILFYSIFADDVDMSDVCEHILCIRQ